MSNLTIYNLTDIKLEAQTSTCAPNASAPDRVEAKIYMLALRHLKWEGIGEIYPLALSGLRRSQKQKEGRRWTRHM